MKTMTGLIPLSIAVALIGVVTWFMLTQGWALGPFLLAALLLAHGWVHVMFAFPQPDPATAGAVTWPFDMTGSWLISDGGIDIGVVRGLGTALMAAVCLGFALAALSTVGLLIPADWWAGLVVASAAGSLALLTMFFSPLLLLGYAIDIVLIGLVLGSVWSPTASTIP